MADSHTLLWLVNGSDRLALNVANIFLDSENEIFASMASLWEIGIKFSLGKLVLKTNVLGLEQELVDMGVLFLPISSEAIHFTTALPWHNRDPFDRIIAATSLLSGNSLLSADPIFDQYGVTRIWD